MVVGRPVHDRVIAIAPHRMSRLEAWQRWYFECFDSINNVGSHARVDFGGANQPKGSEESE